MSEKTLTDPATLIAPDAESRATLAIAQATHLIVVQANDEIDLVRAQLDELERRHKDVVYPVHTSQGLAQARAARMELREPRYKLERRLEAVVASFEHGKRTVKDQVLVLTSRLRALEAPLHAQIITREEEIEEGREERRRNNAEIQAQLEGMRAKALAFVGADVTVEQIRAAHDELVARVLDPELFGKRLPEADSVRQQTIGVLSTLIAREESLAAERAALRQQQAELDARQANADEAMEREKRLHAEELEQLSAQRRQQEEADAAERRQREDAEAAERRRKEDEAREERARAEAEQKRQREAERASAKKLTKGAPRLLASSRALVQAVSGYAALAAPLQAAVADVQIAIQLCTE